MYPWGFHRSAFLAKWLLLWGRAGAEIRLFDALCRFYHAGDGQIKLYGQELSAVDPAVLRSTLRLSTQDSILWNKTVAENILYPNSLESRNETRYQERIHRVLDSATSWTLFLMGTPGFPVENDSVLLSLELFIPITKFCF